VHRLKFTPRPKLNILKLISATAVVALSVSPVIAQAVDASIGTGNNTPVVYDPQGVKHYCLYRWYGPLTPKAVLEKGKTPICDEHNIFYVDEVPSPRVKSTK